MAYMSRDEFEFHLNVLDRATIVGLDTEGTLTHPHSATWGLSYAVPEGHAAYFAFRHPVGTNLPGHWLDELRPVVEKIPTPVFHHAKHDLRSFDNLSINLWDSKYYDIMLMQHWINENTFDKSLDAISKMYGGEPKKMPPMMEKIKNGFGWEAIPVDLWPEYATQDAKITLEAFLHIWPEFRSQDLDGDLWNWERRWIKVLAYIENQGVLTDIELAEREYNRGIQTMDRITKFLGINPGSPNELNEFLIGELGLPVLKRSPTTNKPSFTKKVMERYEEILEGRSDRRATAILAYRGWQKCTSSCYLPYITKRSPVDNRVRTEYRQHRAVTGRLTAELLHQIPRIGTRPWNEYTKLAICTEDGRIAWEFDYSQLEFRLGALYAAASGDERTRQLIDIFNDDDRDIFTEMAAALSMERDPVKTLNYTLQFGGGRRRISEVFNVSMMTAAAIISNYFNTYPGLKWASDFSQARADRNDGVIKLWTGRKRHFKYPDEHRKAFNTVCQGGGFEMVKRQGVRLFEAGLINDECRLDLTVHDSYRTSIEEGKERIYVPEIINIMEDTKSLNEDLGAVHFKVDCHRWASKDKWVA